MQTILFEKQGIKPLKKTPGGRRQRRKRYWKNWRWTIRCQNDSGVSWSGEAEIDLHRQAAVMINPKTGRVHTSYHQAVTARDVYRQPILTCKTFRCVTKKSSYPPGVYWARGLCDCLGGHSQIELRIMAHLSRDKGLLTHSRKEKISTGLRRQKCLVCHGNRHQRATP